MADEEKTVRSGGVLVQINPRFWRHDVVEAEGVKVTHEPTEVTEAVAAKLETHTADVVDNDGKTETIPIVVRVK